MAERENQAALWSDNMAAAVAESGPGAAQQDESLRAEAQRDKSLRVETLARALRRADIAVLRQTPDLLYAEAENLPPLLAAKWHIGCRDEDLFASAIAAEMRRIKLRLLAGGPPEQLVVKLAAAAEPPQPKPAGEAAEPLSETETLRAEAAALARAMAAEQTQSDESPQGDPLRFFGFYSTGGDYAAAEPGSERAKVEQAAGGAQRDESLRGEPLWLRFSFEALRDRAGRLSGILTVAENITELRARQEMLDVLLREVSHRSKNLLAIIQSIAAQTARFSNNTAEFLKKFQGRLQSLSSSQDLVTESDWRGARLQDLIRAQIRFYPAGAEAGAAAGCQIKISGENPYLFPSAALHMGLALHELAVNSASYGALARGAGRISLNCAPENIAAETEAEAEIADSRPGLRLRWREEFPPAEAAGSEADSDAAADNAAAGALNRAHFGSAVLERIVPAALNGRAEYTIKNGIIEYIITFPLENYAAE